MRRITYEEDETKGGGQWTFEGKWSRKDLDRVFKKAYRHFMMWKQQLLREAQKQNDRTSDKQSAASESAAAARARARSNIKQGAVSASTQQSR